MNILISLLTGRCDIHCITVLNSEDPKAANERLFASSASWYSWGRRSTILKVPKGSDSTRASVKETRSITANSTHYSLRLVLKYMLVYTEFGGKVASVHA